jgi:hypothetical protein
MIPCPPIRPTVRMIRARERINKMLTDDGRKCVVGLGSARVTGPGIEPGACGLRGQTGLRLASPCVANMHDSPFARTPSRYKTEVGARLGETPQRSRTGVTSPF